MKERYTQVRAAAYQALAQYPCETLELLEIARPLRDYGALLLAERDAQARAAAEALVTTALAHEHARRRRCEPCCPCQRACYACIMGSCCAYMTDT